DLLVHRWHFLRSRHTRPAAKQLAIIRRMFSGVVEGLGPKLFKGAVHWSDAFWQAAARQPAAAPVARQQPITRALAMASTSALMVFPARKRFSMRAACKQPTGIS